MRPHRSEAFVAFLERPWATVGSVPYQISNPPPSPEYFIQQIARREMEQKAKEGELQGELYAIAKLLASAKPKKTPSTRTRSILCPSTPGKTLRC